MADRNSWALYADVLDLVYTLIVRSLAVIVIFGVAAGFAGASDVALGWAVGGLGQLVWIVVLALTVRSKMLDIREWVEQRSTSSDVTA